MLRPRARSSTRPPPFDLTPTPNAKRQTQTPTQTQTQTHTLVVSLVLAPQIASIARYFLPPAAVRVVINTFLTESFVEHILREVLMTTITVRYVHRGPSRQPVALKKKALAIWDSPPNCNIHI